MLTNRNASLEELTMIWDASKLDEAICLDLYKVLHDIADFMGDFEL